MDFDKRIGNHHLTSLLQKEGTSNLKGKYNLEKQENVTKEKQFYLKILSCGPDFYQGDPSVPSNKKFEDTHKR